MRHHRRRLDHHPVGLSVIASGRGRALGALVLAPFAVGTAELTVVGLLDVIAADVGVSEAAAGQLVTAYGIGLALGGPLLAIAAMGVGRTRLLRLALAGFLAGNLLMTVASSFELMLVARALTGAFHGLCIGTASIVAAELVSSERRGQALGAVYGGAAVATVLGVPLGTLIGQAFGWRAGFGVVAGVGALALIAAIAFVPELRPGDRDRLGERLRAALHPRVLAVFGVATLAMGGLFGILTYLTPYLAHVTGISGALISVYLLALGVASALGTLLGGRLADRRPGMGLLVACTLLAAALALLRVVGGDPVLALVAIAVVGGAGYGVLPPLQLRVIELAGGGADVATTLTSSASSVGLAVGSLAGGWAFVQWDASATVIAGLVLSVLAVPLAWATTRLRTPLVDD